MVQAPFWNGTVGASSALGVLWDACIGRWTEARWFDDLSGGRRSGIVGAGFRGGDHGSWHNSRSVRLSYQRRPLLRRTRRESPSADPVQAGKMHDASPARAVGGWRERHGQPVQPVSPARPDSAWHDGSSGVPSPPPWPSLLPHSRPSPLPSSAHHRRFDSVVPLQSPCPSPPFCSSDDTCPSRSFCVPDVPPPLCHRAQPQPASARLGNQSSRAPRCCPREHPHPLPSSPVACPPPASSPSPDNNRLSAERKEAKGFRTGLGGEGRSVHR